MAGGGLISRVKDEATAGEMRRLASTIAELKRQVAALETTVATLQTQLAATDTTQLVTVQAMRAYVAGQLETFKEP